MALPGKENPFERGLTEKAPVPGMKAKKSFVKIPLSTGAYPPAPEENPSKSAYPANEPTAKAMVKSAIAETATTLPKEPDTQTGYDHVEFTIAASATAKYAIEPLTMVDPATARAGSKKATKVEYAIAKNTIADLADKKGGYTRVDNYVFDALIPKIGSAPAAVVYLYLWRRSLGFQRLSVSLSHQIIAEAVGLSKRTIQEALAKLNELQLVRTERAYETAIPEHFILRSWAAEEDRKTNPAIADCAVAKVNGPYSADCHSAIAASAIVAPEERRPARQASSLNKILNKEIKKSLSQTNLPEAWTEFRTQLTEKARERADRVFESLKNQFPADSINEIGECPKNMERFGAPDGTPWEQIGSPIGLMESSWPQLRDFFRTRLAIKKRAEIASAQTVADKIQADAEAERAEQEITMRDLAFTAAFPTDEAKQEAIVKYIALTGLSLRPESEMGKNMAISRWWSETKANDNRVQESKA